MDRSQKRHDGDRPDIGPGDPGVGGLLSNPLKPSGKHEQPDPAKGRPSPDPAPPRHHGDWTPTKRTASLAPPSSRIAAFLRRKSRNGMPRALFREDDGSTLDDLRVLAMQISRSTQGPFTGPGRP